MRYDFCKIQEASTRGLPMDSLSPAQHQNECDSAHLFNEMFQLNLHWCELVQRLQRYGFRTIQTDGRTDAGYFIVSFPGFFEPVGTKNYLKSA